MGKVVVSFFRDKLPFFLEGQKHDLGLLHQLQLHVISPLGQPMCIYRDPAYILRVQLQVSYRNAMFTADTQAFTTCMSEVRVAAEWLFGDIMNYFKVVDFKKNLKIGLNSVGKMHLHVFMAILHLSASSSSSNTRRLFSLKKWSECCTYDCVKSSKFQKFFRLVCSNSWIIVRNYNLN